MTLDNPTTQGRSIRMSYGVDRGPLAADYHDLALYDDTGTEVTGGGYARARIEPGDWPTEAAADGTLTVVVTFPEPTDAWSTAASRGVLIGDDGQEWDTIQIVPALSVTGAGSTTPQVKVTVGYASTITTEEP